MEHRVIDPFSLLNFQTLMLGDAEGPWTSKQLPRTDIYIDFNSTNQGHPQTQTAHLGDFADFDQEVWHLISGMQSETAVDVIQLCSYINPSLSSLYFSKRYCIHLHYKHDYPISNSCNRRVRNIHSAWKIAKCLYFRHEPATDARM